MTYRRREVTRVEYILPTTATDIEIVSASHAICREAQGRPTVFTVESDRLVFHVDLPGGA